MHPLFFLGMAPIAIATTPFWIGVALIKQAADCWLAAVTAR